MQQLSKLDRILLDLLQDRFPVSPVPYWELAVELGVSEEEIIQRVQHLKETGIVRRIGAIIDGKTLGYQSTLCACQIPPQQLEQTAAIVSAVPGVTHNYQRNHVYNLWFTLSAPSVEEADSCLKQLEKQIGFGITTMPAIRLYKIDARFEMSDVDDKQVGS